MEADTRASKAAIEAAEALGEAERLRVAYDEAKDRAAEAISEASDAESRSEDAITRAEQAIAESKKLQEALESAMTAADTRVSEAYEAEKKATQAMEEAAAAVVEARAEAAKGIADAEAKANAAISAAETNAAQRIAEAKAEASEGIAGAEERANTAISSTEIGAAQRIAEAKTSAADAIANAEASAAGAIAEAKAEAESAISSTEASATGAIAKALSVPTTTTVPPCSFSRSIPEVLPSVFRVKSEVGMGTAFYIGNNEFVTARHVVEESASVTLTNSSATLNALRVWSDAQYDVAILSGSGGDISALQLRRTSTVRPGQEIAAVGFPLISASLASATSGLLSRISAVPALGEGVFLQTDAAVNQGSSGGPLVDKCGEVVGLIVAKAVSVSGDEGPEIAVEGIGWAIPSDSVLEVLNRYHS